MSSQPTGSLLRPGEILPPISASTQRTPPSDSPIISQTAGDGGRSASPMRGNAVGASGAAPMPNEARAAPAIRPAAPANQIPSLTASVRALLADPYSTGDEIPRWEPPARLPDRREVESAVAALRATLERAPSSHIGYWVTTMANTLAMRQGQTQAMASRTDGWLLACGALPADLWTEGCTELLRTKTFMPSPGELMAIVGRKFEERRRMLKRAEWLLASGDPKKPKPFVPEPEDVRLRALRDSLKRAGHTDRAAKYEHRLAVLEQRSPAAWSDDVVAAPRLPKEERPPAVPDSAATKLALLPARVAFWRDLGMLDKAEQLERELEERTGTAAPSQPEP